MQFSESYIDELKQRVPLSKIVSRRVSLKKNGIIHKGLCPFHKEKTPSFTVHDHKGSFYCFGCHESGDIISFVQKLEKYSFEESIKFLAEIAGMELPKEDKKIEEQHLKKLSVIELLEKASKWYQKQLKLSTNYNAYEYFKNRGVNDSDIKDFSLGYAPNIGLLSFFRKENVNLDLMVEAGLAIKADNGSYLERFRNRVIFPIKNSQNRIVGFGGRALDDNLMPKYLNSPETQVFKKNRLLYCGEIAVKKALENERVIVVEGYMDAIFMHKSGIKETVATLGTAFNETHLQALWKIANNPVLCFDGDEAGKKAMIKAAHTALPLLTPGLTLKFCLLPKGLDPDDTIKQYGKDFMNLLIDNSIGLADFIWQNELEQDDLKTPENRAFFEHRVNDLFKQIENPMIKSHYLQFAKTKIWEQFNATRSRIKIKVSRNSDLVIAHMTMLERLKYNLFAQILNSPNLLRQAEIMEIFVHLEVNNDELESLRNCLIDTYDKEDELKDLLNQNNLVKLAELLCGNNSAFVNKISSFNEDNEKEIWLITYKKYLLETIKNEYSDMMRAAFVDKNILEKAMELKLSIDNLTTEILTQENNLT